jgi:hypothetical protein
MERRLRRDMERAGMPCPFSIEVRGYSARYFGKYSHSRRAAVLYACRSRDGALLYPYRDIFLTLVHEWVHYIQYSDPSFVRYRGVMHDARFWEIYGERAATAERVVFGGAGIGGKKQKTYIRRRLHGFTVGSKRAEEDAGRL